MSQLVVALRGKVVLACSSRDRSERGFSSQTHRGKQSIIPAIDLVHSKPPRPILAFPADNHQIFIAFSGKHKIGHEGLIPYTSARIELYPAAPSAYADRKLLHCIFLPPSREPGAYGESVNRVRM